MSLEERSDRVGETAAECGSHDAGSDAGKGKLLRLLENLEPLEEVFPEIDGDLLRLDDAPF